MPERATRGYGLLEGFLARRRAAMARRRLRQIHVDRILDVGCGSFPFFLMGFPAREKVGVDRVVRDGRTGPTGVSLVHHDFEHDPSLPFADDAFDAVTMLAVFEHVEPTALTPLLADIRRVLAPGGTLVLTTPAGWTGPLLHLLALLRLVSSEEIEEHKDAYDLDRIRDHLRSAGFADDRLAFGRFELGANLWATARK